MAELGISIVSTVELCLKWGSKVVGLCKSHQHADKEIKTRLVYLEARWFKTQAQLNFMKQISAEMDAYQLSLNIRTTEQLRNHFRVAWDKLSSAFEDPEIEESDVLQRLRRKAMRWRYAIMKDSIDSALDELEKWHAVVDPSWYLLLRLSNATVNTTLAQYVDNTTDTHSNTQSIRQLTRTGTTQYKKGVFLPSKEMESMLIYDIPFCTAKLAQRDSAHNGTQNLILTTLECPIEARADLVAKEVRELATKLAVNDPKTFGLPTCKGAVKRVSDQSGHALTSFTMVFRSPDNQPEVSSLRGKLLTQDNSITLGDRFVFARQLAKSVSYIHTLEFVHKSVRPESVLIFSEPSPAAYLAGFDHFRKDDGRTYRLGMPEWEKNLYIHPSRQGLMPREDYIMQHDIYSLGVCLLEIGLWESFVVYDADGKNPAPGPVLESFICNSHNGQANAVHKERLVELCQSHLPRRMGRKYSEVVHTCLTCLDPGNDDFGDETDLVDEDGIAVGVAYIETILSRLNEISL